MSRRTHGFIWPVVLALAIGACLQDVASSEDFDKTLVVNLQTPHPVEGEVAVRGTVAHSEAMRLSDLVVSPASRGQTTRWTEAGIIDTAGFTSLALSVQGQVKDTVFQEGDVGVVLLPEEEPFLQAFGEGEVHLPLEVSARAAADLSDYFSASRPGLPIAFPRYRVFLYNSTDRAAMVNVMLYLVN